MPQNPVEREPHEPHWIHGAAMPIVSLVHLGVQTALAWAVCHRVFWLAVPLVAIAGHLMHGLLIAFHEASHGLLRKNRRLNEIDGVLLGVFSFMSLTLYRVAHQAHHLHLGSSRDEEFWPFVLPEVPRWKRVVAALLELNLGLLFTPSLFARIFLRAGSPVRSRRVRRRIWMEFGIGAAIWVVALGAVAWLDLWKYFAWMYLAPGLVAGNLQSWRKYIEHMGMTGSTINGITRSVVARGWAGRLFAFSLLHEPYHGVHHQHAGVPHAKLPLLVASLQPRNIDERPAFPSYRHALRDLLRGLHDPRVGPQWRSANAPVQGLEAS